MKILKRSFWKQEDKQAHFLLNIATVLMIGIILSLFTKFSSLEVTLLSYASSITFWWLKELRDEAGFGTKDIFDLDADFLGSITGVLLLHLFLLYFTGILKWIG